MKITIITPSYNQGKYIEDAIQSVLEQNYSDIEHIIIDGGSKDDTIERLKKYTHLKWISEKDNGQSDALNKGFKIATGDIICWLNCDDFYLPGTFTRVVKEFQDKSIDGVYSDLQFCNEKKEIVDYLRSNRPSKILSLFQTYISSETLFFRRKIIDLGFLVEIDLNYCMDQEFTAKILYNNFKLKYVKSCFATFRWQGENKSLQTIETKRKTLEEGLRIFNKFNGNLSFDTNKSLNLSIYSACRNIFRLYKLFLKFTS